MGSWGERACPAESPRPSWGASSPLATNAGREEGGWGAAAVVLRDRGCQGAGAVGAGDSPRAGWGEGPQAPGCSRDATSQSTGSGHRLLAPGFPFLCHPHIWAGLSHPGVPTAMESGGTLSRSG